MAGDQAQQLSEDRRHCRGQLHQLQQRFMGCRATAVCCRVIVRGNLSHRKRRRLGLVAFGVLVSWEDHHFQQVEAGVVRLVAVQPTDNTQAGEPTVLTRTCNDAGAYLPGSTSDIPAAAVSNRGDNVDSTADAGSAVRTMVMNAGRSEQTSGEQPAHTTNCPVPIVLTNSTPLDTTPRAAARARWVAEGRPPRH